MTVGLAEIRLKPALSNVKTFRQGEDKYQVFQIRSKNHRKTSKKPHRKHFCNIFPFHQDESFPKLNPYSGIHTPPDKSTDWLGCVNPCPDRSIFLSTQYHPKDFEFEQLHELLLMI